MATFALAAGLAAESPFVGTWKLNPAKSKFTGLTMRFERTPSGLTRYTAGGLTYTFKLDGREYPAPLGYTAAWKQVDDRHWDVVYRLHGKVMSTRAITLSDDGRTRTEIETGTKPNGKSFSGTSVFERVSGEEGLLGVWRSTKVQVSTPSVLEIASRGDGITLTLVDYHATCIARFDGKDYPVFGPAVSPGATLSLKLSGDRSIEFVQKDKGKVLGVGTYSVSVDGNELTEVFTLAGVDEPVTAVFERE